MATQKFKSRQKIFNTLIKKYPKVHISTVFHLAVAISLGYTTYVTESDDLLNTSSYLKKVYKINVISTTQMLNIEKGAII